MLPTTASFNGHIARVGVNYHLNWGSARSGRSEILIVGAASFATPGAF
jgi:hypothetical protein